MSLEPDNLNQPPAEPGADLPPSAPPVAEKAKEQKRLDGRREEQRRLRQFLVGLVAITLYFVGFNWYYLHRERQKGLPVYRVLCASSKSVASEYQATLQWQAPAGAALGASPSAQLGGRNMPCAVSIPPTRGQAHSLELAWSIPSDAAPGWHELRLTLAPAAGVSPGEPASSHKFRFYVKSLGEQWWIVRDWLALVGVLYLLIYVVCRFLYAAPCGVLTVKMNSEQAPRKLLLRPRRISWLFPWVRDKLPLAWVSRQMGGLPNVGLHDGTLYFDEAAPPVLELSVNAETVKRWDTDPDQDPTLDPTPDEGQPLGAVAYLYESRAVIFWDSEYSRSATLRIKAARPAYGPAQAASFESVP